MKSYTAEMVYNDNDYRDILGIIVENKRTLQNSYVLHDNFYQLLWRSYSGRTDVMTYIFSEV